MGKRLVAALLVVLGGGLTVWAETMDAPSKITAVTVFPDRALVTRQATLSLPSGLQAVRLPDLPATIEDESVTVKGSGEASVTLYGARVLRQQLDAPQSARVKELEDAIQELLDRKQQLLDAKEVLATERKFFASIQAASSRQIGKDLLTRQPTAADVSELYAFIDRGLTETYQKEQQATAQLRELHKQLDRLERELEQLRGQGAKQQTAIVVDLEATRAGRFTLEVSYRLPGASWQPAYEARAGGQDTQVQLTTYGVIQQGTGEDWDDVSLSLSTAKPAVGGRMPEVEPWWISRREVVVYGASGGVMKMAMMEDRAAPAAAPAPTEPARLAEASAQTQGPAVIFTLPKSESIRSDWSVRKAPIAIHNFPADFAYEVTPRLSPYAYLRAKVSNQSDRVFLPGQVAVFLDGGFVGTSSLELVGPGETFDVFLGIDERIRVERKLLAHKIDVSVLPGLHGRTKTIDTQYLLTIENFRPAPARVTIIDQVPVSQHDEIKVEQISFDPKPAEQDPEKPGVSRWSLTVPSGGKQTIKVSYQVRHPADFDVQGL